MSRSKAEVIKFLNGLVGHQAKDQSDHDLDGQCVALIKSTLKFLGVADPYMARGNAKDYGNALLSAGIAKKGRGVLTVCIDPTMGVVNGITYGHIWLDVKDYANFEQNGAVSLRVTKNTRPASQAKQLINLDKYIGEEMYKGHSAKYWYKSRQFHRNRLIRILKSIDSIAKKRGL